MWQAKTLKPSPEGYENSSQRSYTVKLAYQKDKPNCRSKTARLEEEGKK